MPLFHEVFRNWYLAWFYPFFGHEVFFPRGNIRPVRVPRKYWNMLPTAARLVSIGATISWQHGHMHVFYGGMEFVAPCYGKMVGRSIKEIFIEDVYRIDGRDLTGKVVIDVGAYIGDSTIAFAMQGALVHAFEPIAEIHECLTETIRLNGCADKVVLHAVGLADRDSVGPDNVRFVEVIRYLDEQNIGRIDILKLDCEGYEYELFCDERLLRRLQPAEIVLEYHRGGSELHRFFTDRGYSVEWPERQSQVGYLYARAVQYGET